MLNKLNIGSGEYGIEGYLNIDDASDYDGNVEEFLAAVDDPENIEYQICDGNDMPFEDNSFDEIFSNQCVGKYVTNYYDIVRILKPGGTIILGLWSDVVAKVMMELLIRDIEIIGVEWLNGCQCDIENDDDNITLKVIGRKIGEQ